LHDEDRVTQKQVPSPDRTTPKGTQPLKPARLFYPIAAVLMVVLAVGGFGRFYTQGMAYPDRPIPPPIKTLVITHAAAMTGWLVLLLAQPMLILSRKHRVHMLIGRFGAALAAVIFILGLWLAIRSTVVTPPEARIWGLPPREFFIVPFTAMLIFAGLVTAGVMYRRKPKIHRTMMVLATLSILSAGISRIEPLNNLYVGTMWERMFGPFFLTLALAVVLVGARWAMTRSFDRLFAIGVTALIVVSFGIWQLAPTAVWKKVASLMVS
jgi:hypothetical protein